MSGQQTAFDREKELKEAESLWKTGNYVPSLNKYNNILDHDEKDKADEITIAKDYNNISVVYKLMASYEKAIDYNLRALKLAEKHNDLKISGAINLNLGSLYGAMSRHEESEKYYTKALKELRELKNFDGLTYALVGLASICYYTGDFKKADEYFNQAEENCKENNLDEKLADVYINRSFIELGRENYLRSKKYAFEAKKLYQQLNDNVNVAIAYINLQAAHTNAHRYVNSPEFKKVVREGLAFLDSAEAVLQAIPSPEQYIMIYRNKARSYFNLGEIQDADYYQDRYEAIKDSVYNLDTRKQIEELKFQYETEKKEQEIKLLEKENALLNEKAGKRKLYIAFSLGGGLILVILILIITDYRRKQQKTEQAKDKVVFELQALMAQMNPHFIFNALNSIQHFILDKGKQEAYDYLAKFSKLVRMVLNNSEDKMVSLQKELELIGLYVELEQLRFTNGFDYQLSISENISPENIDLPTMLIQPYVENAIWHGLMNLKNERKGLLRIDIGKANDKLKISIEDNGVGRNRAKQFRKDEMHNSKGMKLTERRLQMINAMKDYENTSVTITDLLNDSGTKVEILLPL